MRAVDVDDWIREKSEAMCNPLGQARALDHARTELGLLLGLCVGHDSLFMQHSAALVTVLAVKDGVVGHNPLAAIYLADGYYHDKLSTAVHGGGRTLLVCTPCLKEREIDASMLVDDAQLVAGARVIQEVTTASAVLNY